MLTPLPPDEDPSMQWMLELRQGREEALEKLIARWQTPLINFFYRSLTNYQVAEDLTQTVFIRLYRAAPNYEPIAKFSTFLFQIARRLLINEYRRAQRKPVEAWDPSDLAQIQFSEQIGPYKEIEEAFELALEKLPENQKTAILLLKQQELSYQEIAVIMEASESAVKTWIYRARQFLKQELKDLV